MIHRYYPTSVQVIKSALLSGCLDWGAEEAKASLLFQHIIASRYSERNKTFTTLFLISDLPTSRKAILSSIKNFQRQLFYISFSRSKLHPHRNRMETYPSSWPSFYFRTQTLSDHEKRKQKIRFFCRYRKKKKSIHKKISPLLWLFQFIFGFKNIQIR